MKINADTNLLVRAIMGDDARQSAIAQAELSEADEIALTLSALCELAWVLARGYKVPNAEIAQAITSLVRSAKVVVNRPAVEAGLIMLEVGGDFADGVIAHEGMWLGAETLATFDKGAAKLLRAKGVAVRLLG